MSMPIEFTQYCTHGLVAVSPVYMNLGWSFKLPMPVLVTRNDIVLAHYLLLNEVRTGARSIPSPWKMRGCAFKGPREADPALCIA